MNPRRYPRTLEEAFGPNPWPITRHGAGPAEKSRRMMRVGAVMAFGVIASCACASFVALVF
jgi:hypothetical protein